jgi:twinkle protein
VGREAAKEIARRLGEHRCRLVELPHKDINECLMAGMDSEAILEYMERAKFFDPDELCSAGDLLQETIEAFEHRDIGLFNSPWTPLNYNFKFRASEMTLINGVNGHGKTELVGHIAVEAMSQGVRTCIASLELKPGKMLARLTRQAICTASPQREEIVMTNEWFSDRLWVFKLTGTAKAGRLLEILRMPAAATALSCSLSITWQNVDSTKRTIPGRKISSTLCAISKTSITATFCW